MNNYKVNSLKEFYLVVMAYVFLVLLSVYLDFWFFVAVLSIIFIYSVFDYVKKYLAKITSPEIGLWLYTGSIGVTFAYLSIALFRQDKKFTKIEVEKLCRYFTKEYGSEVGKITREFVLKFKRAKVDLHLQTREVAELDRNHRLMFLYNLFSMAMADGMLKAEEERYLWRVAQLINLNTHYFKMIKSKFVKIDSKNQGFSSNQHNNKNKNYSERKSFSKQFFSSNMSAYLSLELNKNATNEDVKKAYRKLVKKYHPDRLNGQSEVSKKIAKQRFREIYQAYELIKKERGMK